MQIIPRTPGIGELFGAGLSEGIGSGLESYFKQQADAKKAELKQQADEQKFKMQQSALQEAFPEISGSPAMEAQGEPRGPSKATDIPFEKRVVGALQSGLVDAPRAGAMLKAYEATPEAQIKKQTLNSDIKRGDEYQANIDSRREGLTSHEFDVSQMEQALANETGSGRALNVLSTFLANSGMPGTELLRTAEGAQLEAATKNYIIKTVGSLGGRPNQWIEQQIAKALPLMGQSPEANKIVVAGLKYANDMERQRLQISDQVAKEMKAQQGYVGGDISRIVDERMRPIIDERQKDLALQQREIHEQYHPPERKDLTKHVAQGTPLTGRMNQFIYDSVPKRDAKGNPFPDDQIDANVLKLAKNLGYSLP